MSLHNLNIDELAEFLYQASQNGSIDATDLMTNLDHNVLPIKNIRRKTRYAIERSADGGFNISA